MKGNRLFLILIVSLLFSNNVKSQQLNVQETVAYINQVMKNNKQLTISEDGYLHYSGEYIDNRYKGAEFSYSVHLSDLRPPDRIIPPDPKENIFQAWQIPIVCKTNYCMRYIVTSEGGNLGLGEPYPSSFSIKTKIDKYSTEKLLNAMKYLFSIVEEEGLLDRYDDDPFAPKNFQNTETVAPLKGGAVKLSKQGGVYYIPVTIGEIKNNFIFDTGASDVLISEEFERMLIENGTIKKRTLLIACIISNSRWKCCPTKTTNYSKVNNRKYYCY